MGRMVGKRPRLDLPPKLDIFSKPLNNMASEQEEGQAFYGQYVYSKDKRVTSNLSSSPLLYALQVKEVRPPEVWPLDYRKFQVSVTPALADELRMAAAMAAVASVPKGQHIVSLTAGVPAGGPLPLTASAASSKPSMTSEEKSKLSQEGQKLGGNVDEEALSADQAPLGIIKPQETTLTSRMPRPMAAQAPADDVQSGSQPFDKLLADSQESLLLASEAQIVGISRRCTARDDSRVTLKGQLDAPPAGFSGCAAHQLPSLEGVKFFQLVEIVDGEDSGKIYRFSLTDAEHCACFHLGVGVDGTALISWSELYALYQLPDGSKWAEHGYFYDTEDLESLARKLGKDHRPILAPDATDRELYRKQGRYHSRLQNIEYECWVFKGQLPAPELLQKGQAHDAYYWRFTFHPTTLALVHK